MKLFKYNDLIDVKIDENFDDENYSSDIEDALLFGYDKKYPIVLDEDNCILDGNHRFVAFSKEGRKDELVFCKVAHSSFFDLKYSFTGEEYNRFNFDDDFFYNAISEIAYN